MLVNGETSGLALVFPETKAAGVADGFLPNPFQTVVAAVGRELLGLGDQYCAIAGEPGKAGDDADLPTPHPLYAKTRTRGENNGLRKFLVKS